MGISLAGMDDMKTTRRKTAPRKNTPKPPLPERGPVLSVASPRRPTKESTAAFIPSPEETHQRVPDDLAEYLGEGFVQSVTTGNDIDPDIRDAVQTEELGGPFVETSGRAEFG